MRHSILAAALSLSTLALGCQEQEHDLEGNEEEASAGDSEDMEDAEEEFRGGISPLMNFQVGANAQGHRYDFWVDGSSSKVMVYLCYSQGFGKYTKVELLRNGLVSNHSYGTYYYNNGNANCVGHTWWGVQPASNHHIRIKKHIRATPAARRTRRGRAPRAA